MKKRRRCHRDKSTSEEHLANQDACNGVWLTSSNVSTARKHSPLVMLRRDIIQLCTQRKNSCRNVLNYTLEMAVKHRKIASKDAIIRRKESYLTWDSLNSSIKVVPPLKFHHCKHCEREFDAYSKKRDHQKRCRKGKNVN